MRVLIACPPVDNPYVRELVRSLGSHEGIEECHSGVDRLLSGSAEADIVHIQWPEALFGWKEPEPEVLSRLTDSLASLRANGTGIVTTVHNEVPHARRSGSGAELYKAVLSSSHALIHFGKASYRILRARYGSVVDSCSQWIIPHGDYSVFLNGSQMQPVPAGASADGARFLVFGAIRDAREVGLIRALLREVRRRKGTLSIVARLPHRSRRAPAYYRTRLPFWIDRRVSMQEVFVPDDKVHECLESCDVVVLPRHNTLNSGNIALAYTFGKVVLGPGIGNIGEELRASGNAVFDPQSPQSLSRAVDTAIDLARKRHGDANRRRAEDLMNWKGVADQHYRLYRFIANQANQASEVSNVVAAEPRETVLDPSPRRRIRA